MLTVPPFLADHDTPLPCRTDPDLFFADNKQGRTAAADICHTCPARTPCAEYATARPELRGVWGGLTRSKRTELRRRRRAEPPPAD